MGVSILKDDVHSGRELQVPLLRGVLDAGVA
jgi:hypothetical protein